jgi:hypothetical protein
MKLLTEQREGGGAYEQVLEVGGGDVFLGLVGREEAELADHLVAAPQELDPLPDPFLPSAKSKHVISTTRPREPNLLALMTRTTKRSGGGGDLVEGGAGGEAVEPGRPVEEGGEREVGVGVLHPRRRVEAHLRVHPVPDFFHLHHFDWEREGPGDRRQNPRAGQSRGEERKQRRESAREALRVEGGAQQDRLASCRRRGWLWCGRVGVVV